MANTNALYQTYKKEIVPSLMSEFSCKNIHQVANIQKITLNMGLGEAVQNPKIIESAVEQLALISGQKPVVTRSKKSIAGFKLRENVPIGCMVTLRGQRMWDFLERLVGIALPRIRDFRGVSPKAFDGDGNYTMGIKEQLVFPEIDFDKIDKVRGLNITIVTTTPSNDQAKALLTGLGFPFRK
ncbi:MAG: 50S ribosomal protein L5 [SAR324 cluster bacterium]|nr:50S ribosomal protein L5 [SAR324 cluster bacterium]